MKSSGSGGVKIQAILQGKNFSQNTIDLQWKMRANYNASPCADEEKAAGAGTIANNRKNNAQSNRNSQTSGRVPTPDWTPVGDGVARERRQVGCDGSALHPRDVPEATKKPADEQRRASVAEIRD
jgi:hypothetical protein